MSTVDRAFIRAFEGEPAQAGASPTMVVGSAKPQAMTGAASSVGGNVLAVGPPAPHFQQRAIAAVQGAGRTERRPLSTFAAPQATVDARFRPALEVDAFDWSATVTELTGAHQLRWRTAVDTLIRADADGCSLVGLAGIGSGVGATTTTLCLARLLAKAGKTIAIVDADFCRAEVAAQLGLAVQLGWEDVLAGRTPLAQAMIHSLGDGVALLPLVAGGVPAAEKLDAIHASVTAGVLRYHYDIVLFDLGDATDPVQSPIARRVARNCRLDAALLVVSGDWRSRNLVATLDDAAPELASICRGTIENRVLAK